MLYIMSSELTGVQERESVKLDTMQYMYDYEE